MTAATGPAAGSKHTPGPWITEESNGGMFGVMDERGYAIADMAVTYSSIDGDDEHEANARLIAAAPELLEALQNCIAAGVPAEVEKAARAAIAKATGATP